MVIPLRHSVEGILLCFQGDCCFGWQGSLAEEEQPDIFAILCCILKRSFVMDIYRPTVANRIVRRVV